MVANTIRLVGRGAKATPRARFVSGMDYVQMTAPTKLAAQGTIITSSLSNQQGHELVFAAATILLIVLCNMVRFYMTCDRSLLMRAG